LLFALRDSEQGKLAREYLRKRGIEADVVHAGPIGVVPSNLDVDKLHKVLKATYEKVKITPPEKPAGRTKEEILEWRQLKMQAEQFEASHEALVKGFKTLETCGGWLALFYSNEHGLCAVKLRNIETKDFRMIGTGACSGQRRKNWDTAISGSKSWSNAMTRSSRIS